MIPAASLEDRLRTLHADLVREFDHLDGESVTACFHATVDGLMATARIPDFVPILARRYTTERLHELQAVGRR